LDNERKDKALEYLNKFVKEIPQNPTLMALKAYIKIFFKIKKKFFLCFFLVIA